MKRPPLIRISFRRTANPVFPIIFPMRELETFCWDASIAYLYCHGSQGYLFCDDVFML